MEIQRSPLRERHEDIPELSRFLLAKACKRLRRPEPELTAGALAAPAQHDWPGNVREPENAIERAVVLSDGTAITEDHLALPGGNSPAGHSPELSLDEYFRRFVLENEGHMTETELACRLGISRKALWERHTRMGIPRKVE
jgi:DNA-binding NtrC family response regulator